MKKLFFSIFISMFVIVCNAQTKAEANNSNTRQTEIAAPVDGGEKHSIAVKDNPPINTTVKTDDHEAVPVQTEKSEDNRTSKKNPASRKREEN